MASNVFVLAFAVVISGCTTPRAARGGTVVASSAASSISAGAAPDPLDTDPDKYSLVLENEYARVLRYHDEAGAQTHPHHHRQFVLVVLAPFRRRLTFAGGVTMERDFRAGQAIWMPEQTHAGENIGTTPTDVLLIEVKKGR
jgi:beta-alanine degradation protein BauB